MIDIVKDMGITLLIAILLVSIYKEENNLFYKLVFIAILFTI